MGEREWEEKMKEGRERNRKGEGRGERERGYLIHISPSGPWQVCV
jgi:hypothetical protein